jgi:hypothetical protein
MRTTWRVVLALLVCWACGGTTEAVDGGSDSGLRGSSGSTGGGSGGASSGSSSSNGSSGSNSSSGGSGSSSGSGGLGSSSGSISSSSGNADCGVCGRVPINHRPNDSQCQTPAPAGNCPLNGGIDAGPPGSSCTTDGQCMSGTNGRCFEPPTRVASCVCTYDVCMHDADCGAGETCACRGVPYAYGQGNTCLPGNCRIDGDCGPGGYCSPSYDVGSCSGVGGYYCHTPSDTCVDDGECGPPFPGGSPPKCTYSSFAGAWQCVHPAACH